MIRAIHSLRTCLFVGFSICAMVVASWSATVDGLIDFDHPVTEYDWAQTYVPFPGSEPLSFDDPLFTAYWKETNTSLAIGLVVNRNIGDTTYGVNPAPNGGRPKMLEDLIQSDLLDVVLYDSGGASIGSIRQTFLNDDREGGRVDVDEVMENPVSIVTPTMILPSQVLNASTSMVHNFGLYGYDEVDMQSPDTLPDPNGYAVANPYFSNWEFSIIYELEISRDAYSGSFGSLGISELHISPNNLPRPFPLEQSVPGELIDLQAASGIPEPSISMLGLFGLIGGALHRRRRV